MKELVSEIIADGIVDLEEVKGLKAALYADGKIDKDEADALFEINDAVTGGDNDPAYGELFVKALTDFVLADEVSPGVVDDIEGKYLVEKIGADGQVDGLEKELLLNIKEKATSINSKELNDLIDTL